MKIYTRKGDDGGTALFGPGRVRKDDFRVEAYGTVDELNAVIGFARVACDAGDVLHVQLRAMFDELQSRLFDIGADLATPGGVAVESKVHRTDADDVEQLEDWIDEIEAGNTPMKSFVMPSGTELATRIHMARTVCRRAERRMVTLADDEPMNQVAIAYINRLSDLLFVMARRVNADTGVEEVKWIPAKKREN